MPGFDLRQVSIFSALGDRELAAIRERSRTVTYRPNAVVVTEGGEKGPLYIIESGRARVFMTDSNGKEFNINHLSAGDYFGELSIFDDQPRSASVIALETSRMILVGKDMVRELLGKSEFSLELVKELVFRTRVLSAKLCTMACRNVYDRIVTFLVDNSEAEDDHHVTTMPLSHEDIANNVGATRESVTRIINSLQNAGFIQRVKGKSQNMPDRRKAYYLIRLDKLERHI